MRESSTSVALWRSAIVVLALVGATQLAIEALHAPRALSLGVRGAQLFEGGFLRERGPTTFVVDALPPGSPLAEAGVVPGDRLQWDTPLGRWYNVAAGERMALTVLHGDTRRNIEFTMPAAPRLPRHEVANYVLGVAISLFGLVLGVTVGWRRADLTAYRGLAASALLVTIAFPYSAPAGAHVGWLDFVSSVSQELWQGALVFFAINYPDDRPTGWRAILKRYYPPVFVLKVLAEIVYFARLYGGHFETGFNWVSRIYEVALPALFIVTIIATWRQAHGEARIRLQWILATLGAILGATLLANLNWYVGRPVPGEDVSLVVNVTVLAAMLGLAYAIVRRRIFDFGLAVNRGIVFTVVGAILLGVFQIAHALAGRYLRFDDRNQALVLSAVLAVAVYLSFNYLKKFVERGVDRLFFSRWAVREDDLRRFVKEAAHASDAGALGALLVAAVDRFTQGTGCALYRQRDHDAWLRNEATLAGAPERIDVNHETVLALVAHDKALRVRDSASLPATWAFAMVHRGRLYGFVLLGAQGNGDPYRPDQIAALETAVHRVGLDFYALQIDRLESELASARRAAQLLGAQLDTAMRMAARIKE